MDKNEEIKEDFCTLYLVRHGETEWNLKNIIQGQSDSPLTEKGKAQALETAMKFEDIHFDAIFSSDTPRAFHTAEVIKQERDLIIETSELLRERSFGSYEGEEAAVFEEAFKKELEISRNLKEGEYWPYKLAEDIESNEELAKRFLFKLNDIAVTHLNQIVLVVSHGGDIRTLLLKTKYQTEKELSVKTFQNAGYIKTISDGNSFIIKEVNGLVDIEKKE